MTDYVYTSGGFPSAPTSGDSLFKNGAFYDWTGVTWKIRRATPLRSEFIATANQATVTGLTYFTGSIDCYINGAKMLLGTDFTATDGVSVTFTPALDLDDEVQLIMGVSASSAAGGGVVTGTTLPDPVSDVGSLFYLTTINELYLSNGTLWALITNVGPTATGGTVVIPEVLSESGSYSYNLSTNFTDDVNTGGELTYTLESGTLPTGCVLPTSGNSTLTGTIFATTAADVLFNFVIKASDEGGKSATQTYQWTVFVGVVGETVYTTAGTYTWVVPEDVTSVSAVAVGGGASTSHYQGGAGGGLSIINNVSVIPGESYTVVVGEGGTSANMGTWFAGGDSSVFTITATAGGATGGSNRQGSFTSQAPLGGVGNSGTGGGSYGYVASGNTVRNTGGGGAGGYTADGSTGTGIDHVSTHGNGNAGGGVGLFGGTVGGGGGTQGGANGTGTSGTVGIGGSGGADGSFGIGGSDSAAGSPGVGGLYGGGAGSGGGYGFVVNTGDGGGGAVRIMWGPNRTFPSDAAQMLPLNQYFDVTYKSPKGTIGTHNAVKALNEFEASRISPVMLSYGTPWKPEEFTVMGVEVSKNPPSQTIKGEYNAN